MITIFFQQISGIIALASCLQQIRLLRWDTNQPTSLVRVLVPEEGESCVVAVLMPVDVLQVKLHEHPLCVSDEVVDVFSIAFQPVWRCTCQWI